MLYSRNFIRVWYNSIQPTCTSFLLSKRYFQRPRRENFDTNALGFEREKNYDKENFQKVIRVRTMENGPLETFSIGKWNRVFVDVKNHLIDKDIIFRIGMSDVAKKLNKNVYLKLPSAKFILNELVGIIQLIKENEGHLDDLPPNEKLYAKRFYDETDGYETSIKLVKAEKRRHGDMMLFIYSKNLNIRVVELRKVASVFIISSKVQKLYDALKRVVEAYEIRSTYVPDNISKDRSQ